MANEQDASSESELITWLHSPKPKRSAADWLIWLTVLVSLGLHGLLLLAPTPTEEKPAIAKPEEKKVRITQLPTVTQRQATPRATVRASPRPTPALRRPARPRTTPPLVSVRRSPTPAPATPAPATPASAQPMVAPAGTSEISFLQDFPQYPGAQAGCYNLPSCQQTGKPIADVSSFFERELAAKKFTAVSQINEPGRQVYQVSRDGVAQFLSLIEVPGRGTLYVLAGEPRTLTDLGQAEEVPVEIENIFSGLETADVTPEYFTDPAPFYSGGTPRPEISGMKVVPYADTPDVIFDTYFRNNLINSQYEIVGDPQQFAGGPMYEVKKDNHSLYINLLPTADGAGTLVVVWGSQPRN